MNEFEISAPQYSTRSFPVGNGDVLDIVVHKNIWLSEVIVSDNMDSDKLPVVFHLLNHVRAENLWDSVGKFKYWERFQSLASESIPTIIQINSGEEVDKAARVFTAPIASVYRLLTSKIIFSELR
jgi:hypothetical protein